MVVLTARCVCAVFWWSDNSLSAHQFSLSTFPDGPNAPSLVENVQTTLSNASKVNCYCYNEDGSKNQSRKDSTVCQNTWLTNGNLAPTNYKQNSLLYFIK